MIFIKSFCIIQKLKKGEQTKSNTSHTKS